MLSCGVCVRPSVTFVSRVKANKDMFEIFSPSGIQAILVFPRQTEWRYSDGTPQRGGGSNAGGVGKKRDSGRIAAYRSTVLSTVRVANCERNKAATDGVESSTHGGVRRPLFARDDDGVFVTGSTLYAGEEVKHPRTQPPWS